MVEHAYGVVYNPSNVQSYNDQKSMLLTDDFLDSVGVNFIRITWVDWINNIRYRVIPRPYFRKLLESSRPGVSLAKVSFGLVFLAMAPGFTGTGEYHYVLDLSSFRLAPYAPGHASVMGFFQNKLPTPKYGLTVPFCPRTLLKRIAKRAQDEAGVTYLVGFESEFILLSSTSPKIVPVNDADWSVSSKLPSGSVEAIVLEEIAVKLAIAGIEVQMYHAEAAPGQVRDFIN
jgi:glutamine synthetase